jgi:hypothetical protein
MTPGHIRNFAFEVSLQVLAFDNRHGEDLGGQNKESHR